MGVARITFDSGLPFVVATSDLPCGPKRFVRGEAFPWRELGLSEADLLELWVALKLDCQLPIATVAPKPQGRREKR